MQRLTIENAQEALKHHGGLFRQLLKHGTLEVEYYKPEDRDYQAPHSRDEIYVIASGSGFFLNGESREPFEMGEVLFVPAGVEHRFEEFTDDFATWVFFYGPEGGELRDEDDDSARFRSINPVLPSTDVARSIDFYVTKLGFRLMFQDSQEAPQYAGVGRGAVSLHLQWHDEQEWDRVERPMIRFVIENVGYLFDEWSDREVFHEQTAVRETIWRTKEFAFFDPDMNGLTFYSDLED